MADTLVAAPYTDLVVWLDIPDQAFPTDRAKLALESATALIQAYLGQRLLPVANETVTFPVHGSTLWLPERPVTAVGAVTTTDDRGVTTARTLNTHYYVVGPQIRWASSVWSSTGPVLATVTYSHGYATAPEVLRTVCLSVAARLVNNPSGLRQETVGSVSWTAAGGEASLGAGLLEQEKTTLERYAANPGLA